VPQPNLKTKMSLSLEACECLGLMQISW